FGAAPPRARAPHPARVDRRAGVQGAHRPDAKVRHPPARVLRSREAHAPHRRQARAAEGGTMTGLELKAFLDVLPVPAMLPVGRRVLGAHHRMGKLVGLSPEEILATPDPILRFIAGEDQPMLIARIAARARGEPVSDEMDFVVVTASGQRIPSRTHVAPFPAAGTNAVMVVITHERLRARQAQLIRGFVDVAVAAQRERTQAGILRVSRDELQRLGLSVTLCELGAGRFRILDAGSDNPYVSALQQKWPDWIPDSAFPIARASAEGLL